MDSLKEKPVIQAPTLKNVADYASSLLNECARCQDPEQAQERARKLDNLLKDLSILQADLGVVRRDMSKHIAKLRKASPKAKKQGAGFTPIVLEEGKTYYHEGAVHLYSGGKLKLISTTNEES